MSFDLPRLIELNRLALLRLVGVLFAQVGIVPGGVAVETVPHCVRLAVLRVLRTAESATRRLIFAKAQRLDVSAGEAESAEEKPALKRDQSDAPVPPFALFDPKKHFEELHPERTRYLPGPCIRFFDERDPPFPQPPEEAEKKVPMPDDPVSAKSLCRRLQAVFRALQNLDAQALRMARAKAKRAQAGKGPAYAEPLRLGFAPGYRRKKTHEVDGVLSECDRLARRALEPQDSS